MLRAVVGLFSLLTRPPRMAWQAFTDEATGAARNADGLCSVGKRGCLACNPVDQAVWPPSYRSRASRGYPLRATTPRRPSLPYFADTLKRSIDGYNRACGRLLRPQAESLEALAMRKLIIGPLLAYLAGLRFPILFGIAAVLFVIDLFIPDVIPFADEILLGLGAALLGAWKRKRQERGSGPVSP